MFPPPPPPPVTVTENGVAVDVSPVDVPFSEPLYVPAAIPAPTVRLTVTELPVVDEGFTAAVMPAGKPVTAKFTVPANPPDREIFAVSAPVPPAAIDTTPEVNATVKPCAAFTVSVNGAVIVAPPVPVARRLMV